MNKVRLTTVRTNRIDLVLETHQWSVRWAGFRLREALCHEGVAVFLSFPACLKETSQTATDSVYEWHGYYGYSFILDILFRALVRELRQNPEFSVWVRDTKQKQGISSFPCLVYLFFFKLFYYLLFLISFIFLSYIPYIYFLTFLILLLAFLSFFLSFVNILSSFLFLFFKYYF